MFKVGDKVKILSGYGSEFKNRVGFITTASSGRGSSYVMVSSKEGLPEHYCYGEEFHLNFLESNLEKIDVTEGLALFDWANK